MHHVRTMFPHVGLDSDLPINADWLAGALSGEYGTASLPVELMGRLTYFGLGIYRSVGIFINSVTIRYQIEPNQIVLGWK